MEGNSPKKRSFSDMSSSPHGDSTLSKFLRTAKLPLSEEQHRQMDQRVLARLQFTPPEHQFDISGAQLLLSTIVNGALDFMNRDLTLEPVAIKFITDHPLLQQMLQDAWLARSFRTIRELAILQDLHTITSAWTTPYNGSLHVLLNDNINSMSRYQAHSNFVSIVQSSGTGKSRMVHEQSNIVFTIPFCLRDKFDEDLPYPHADDEVRDHLTRYTPRDHSDNVEAYYFVFLRHLFEVVRNTLIELYGPKERAVSYNALATSWKTYLETSARKLLYDTVVRKATEGWKQIDETVEKYGREHAKMDPIRVDAASYEAKRELDNLLSTIDECVSRTGVEDAKRLKPNAIKLVVYFDEAHVLRRGRYLYGILCYCFTYFITRPIFFIFLSTNPSLEFFETRSSMSSSARMRESFDALQAPITEVPFDCAGLLVKPHTLRLQDVCSIEFMSQLGRPLFWSLVKGAGQRKDEMLAELVDLMRGKLICKPNIQYPYSAFLTPAALLAVVDVRLMLDYGPQKEAILLQAELVASHMRIVYSIPQNQCSLWSGYSSEPILAEAAAQQMHTLRQYAPSALIDILKENIQSGMIERGLRGELLARALVVSAYDRAVEVDHPPPEAGRPPLYSRGCSVITFIQELFREEYANEILDSVPANVSNSVKFRDAFEHAQIRFTHFVKMADNSGTTTHAMFAGFVRGFAAICFTGEKTVDFMLPVLLWDELLCEEVMSAIMVKVQRETRVKYEIEESQIGFFPPAFTESDTLERSSMRPYITLTMELGVQSGISETTKTRVRDREKPKAAKTTTKTPSTLPKTQPTFSKAKPGRNQHASNHPRYNIFAHGCSSTVYKVIEASQKEEYPFLLGSGSFLDEHPRKSRNTLSTVNKMKPFWGAGEDCFHWYKNDFLSTTQTEHEDSDEGWLVTGCGMESDEVTSVSDEDTNVLDEGTDV